MSNEKSGDETTNFVPIGTTWNRRVLTYFFENGTPDITANDERQAFRDAFTFWSAQTNLRFLEVCNANDADISVRWATANHGDGSNFDGQNGVLAHTLGGPPPNTFGNNAGDIHFDEAENWTLATRNGTAAQPIDFVTVAAHEVGHALGLNHTTVAGSLMLAAYTGSHRFLGNDDRLGIQSLYASPTANGIIRGPFVVCSTGNANFTFDVPPGVTGITWTRSSNLQYVSGQGTNHYVVRATGSSGMGWVQVVLQSACGNTVTIRRDVQSGAFTTSQITVSGTTGVCPGQAYNYTANVPGGHATGYTYTWTYPSGWSVFSQSSNTIRLYVPSGNSQYGAVRVSVNNGCGASGPTGVTVYPGFSCGSSLTSGEFVIYPNPADEQLTIEQSQAANLTSKITIASQEMNSNQPGELTSSAQSNVLGFQVELLNGQQITVAKGTSKDKKVRLDTKALDPGTYYLQIRHGKTIRREQIIIQ